MPETLLIPSAKVLEAFCISAQPTRLSGGQATSYRAGNVLLKPTDNAEETSWIASVYEEIKQDGFRIAHYVESVTGEWVVDRWFAQEYLEGTS